MATYTPDQLYGNGSIGEDITTSITFAFDNPSGSSYFTVETVQDSAGTLSGKQLTTDGTWIPSSQTMGPVQSLYFVSVAVPPGQSSVILTPTSGITGTNYRMKGTGAFSMTTSTSLIDAFKLRVFADSGTYSAEACQTATLTALNNI